MMMMMMMMIKHYLILGAVRGYRGTWISWINIRNLIPRFDRINFDVINGSVSQQKRQVVSTFFNWQSIDLQHPLIIMNIIHDFESLYMLIFIFISRYFIHRCKYIYLNVMKCPDMHNNNNSFILRMVTMKGG